MKRADFRHSFAVKAIALAVMGMILLNEPAYAFTRPSGTLVPESRINSFSYEQGVLFRNRTGIMYAAGEIRDLIDKGTARPGNISRLSGDLNEKWFPGGDVRIAPVIGEGTLTSGKKYKSAFFHFTRTDKRIKAVFTGENDELGREDLEELGVIGQDNDGDVFSAGSGLIERVWLVSPVERAPEERQMPSYARLREEAAEMVSSGDSAFLSVKEYLEQDFENMVDKWDGSGQMVIVYADHADIDSVVSIINMAYLLYRMNVMTGREGVQVVPMIYGQPGDLDGTIRHIIKKVLGQKVPESLFYGDPALIRELVPSAAYVQVDSNQNDNWLTIDHHKKRGDFRHGEGSRIEEGPSAAFMVYQQYAAAGIDPGTQVAWLTLYGILADTMCMTENMVGAENLKEIIAEEILLPVLGLPEDSVGEIFSDFVREAYGLPYGTNAREMLTDVKDSYVDGVLVSQRFFHDNDAFIELMPGVISEMKDSLKEDKEHRAWLFIGTDIVKRVSHVFAVGRDGERAAMDEVNKVLSFGAEKVEEYDGVKVYSRREMLRKEMMKNISAGLEHVLEDGKFSEDFYRSLDGDERPWFASYRGIIAYALAHADEYSWASVVRSHYSENAKYEYKRALEVLSHNMDTRVREGVSWILSGDDFLGPVGVKGGGPQDEDRSLIKVLGMDESIPNDELCWQIMEWFEQGISSDSAKRALFFGQLAGVVQNEQQLRTVRYKRALRLISMLDSGPYLARSGNVVHVSPEGVREIILAHYPGATDDKIRSAADIARVQGIIARQRVLEVYRNLEREKSGTGDKAGETSRRPTGQEIDRMIRDFTGLSEQRDRDRGFDGNKALDDILRALIRILPSEKQAFALVSMQKVFFKSRNLVYRKPAGSRDLTVSPVIDAIFDTIKRYPQYKDNTRIVFLRAGAEALYEMSDIMARTVPDLFSPERIHSIWATMGNLSAVMEDPGQGELFLKYLYDQGILSGDTKNILFVDTDTRMGMPGSKFGFGTEALIYKTLMDNELILRANRRFGIDIPFWNDENGYNAEIFYLNMGDKAEDREALQLFCKKLGVDADAYSRRMRFLDFSHMNYEKAYETGASLWWSIDTSLKLESIDKYFTEDPDTGLVSPVVRPPYNQPYEGTELEIAHTFQYAGYRVAMLEMLMDRGFETEKQLNSLVDDIKRSFKRIAEKEEKTARGEGLPAVEVEEPGGEISADVPEPGVTEKTPSSAGPRSNVREKAAMVHSYNVEFALRVPEKNLVFHVISEDIIPAGQINMVRELQQKMRGEEYPEKVVLLPSGTDRPEDFSAELLKLKQRIENRYGGYGIEFNVACPGREKVGIAQSLGMGALGFEKNNDKTGSVIQVEGIILALRALSSGNPSALLKVYNFLTGHSWDGARGDINELARELLFILPAAEPKGEKTRDVNDLIRQNILNAA